MVGRRSAAARLLSLGTAFLITQLGSLGLRAQEETEDPFEKLIATSVRYDGLLDFYWNAESGRIHLELAADQLEQELLYVVSLASGLGSNPVGLDRGQLGPQRVVAFERSGPKVLLTARNYRFRALSQVSRERQAVAESFAPSVIWGFQVAAEKDGRMLLDATDFLLRDAHGVVGTLRGRGQGDYRLDGSRSAVHLPRCKAFPDNSEFESTLTYTSGRAGRLVSQTAADGQAFTLRQHHSFIRLPDDGYTPRAYDPRIGYMAVTFMDYATPLDQPMTRRWVRRHRLQKKDPTAALSEAVEPIVYYLDPGTPEPVRSALLEGASWWAEAFTAAGFRDAFRVEVLPADADPMDVRYNMIHWVHRSTRGWSYGGAIADPRTGEILKGNVLLGSLRVRQDHLLFTGLGAEDAACAADGGPHSHYLLEPAAAEGDAVELSLARIRQLSAHEVGHSLGLTHNFAASTYDDRASVMDYPAPMVLPDGEGGLDFSRAYGVGVGTYDVWAIRWGYSQWAPGTDEAAALDALIQEGLAAGQIYITDQDARGIQTSHPLASLWDNGSDPLEMLRTQMEVRALGLQRFGTDRLQPGTPVATLEELLVPLYLHHRYQVEAAAKLVGGLHFRYAVQGDGQPGPAPEPSARQLQAIDTLCDTLALDFLRLPDAVAQAIPPHPPGFGSGEVFGSDHRHGIDPTVLAQSAARMTVAALLEPGRAARLEIQAARDPGFPGLGRVIDRLIAATWGLEEPARRADRALSQAVETVVVDGLMQLADNQGARDDVRALAMAGLRSIHARCGEPTFQSEHERATHRRLDHWFTYPTDRVAPSRAPQTPEGMPIGSSRGR